MIIQNMQYLYLIFLLAFPGVFLWLRYKRRLAFLSLIYTQQYLERYRIPQLYLYKSVVLFLLFCLFILYLLSPALRIEKTFKTEAAAVSDLAFHIILDSSLSMYARDAAISRMVLATRYIRRTVEKNQNLAFSLSVFTDKLSKIVPLSTDRDFLFRGLDFINQAPVISGSTDISKLFDDLEKKDAIIHIPDKKNYILVVSDWESHTPVNPNIYVALKNFYDKFYFAVSGSTKEAVLFDSEGRVIRNSKGEISYSKANPKLAKQFSNILGAQYISLHSNSEALSIEVLQEEYLSLLWVLSIVISLLFLIYIILEQ